MNINYADDGSASISDHSGRESNASPSQHLRTSRPGVNSTSGQQFRLSRPGVKRTSQPTDFINKYKPFHLSEKAGMSLSVLTVL